MQRPISYQENIEELTANDLASWLGFLGSPFGGTKEYHVFFLHQGIPRLSAPTIRLRAKREVPPALILKKDMIFRSLFSLFVWGF
ncbi:MAG: hypothetical protein KBT50_08555 [Cycloclasticus sp.]|nr:hypothetical protein [Cycloclasticus sp.]